MIQAGNNHPTVTAVTNELKTEQGLTNYPNPFSGSTTIQFQTSSMALVVLDVFDIMGGRISTLIDKELPAGIHRIDFNGSSLPAGLYFCRLKVGSHSTTQKMILVR